MGHWETGIVLTMDIAESCPNLDVTGLYKNGLQVQLTPYCSVNASFAAFFAVTRTDAGRREIQILVFRGGGGTRFSVGAGCGISAVG